MNKSKLKKLRRRFERLSYQVQALELEQRLTELQKKPEYKPAGFQIENRKEREHGEPT